jgi:hypothetical protein
VDYAETNIPMLPDVYRICLKGDGKQVEAVYSEETFESLSKNFFFKTFYFSQATKYGLIKFFNRGN